MFAVMGVQMFKVGGKHYILKNHTNSVIYCVATSEYTFINKYITDIQ